MNKMTRYAIILGTILAVLTVLYFAIPYPHVNSLLYVFSYLFLAIAILAQLYPMYLFLYRSKTLKSKVYGLTILKVGFIYAGLQVLVTIIFAIMNAFFVPPVWLFFTLEVLVLAFAVIGFITLDTYKNQIEEIEHKTEQKVDFMDTFKSEVKVFTMTFSNQLLKKKFDSFVELVIYSDPVSSEEIVEIEDILSQKYYAFKSSYQNVAINEAEHQLDELINLVNQRNILCKQFKSKKH